MIGSSIVIPVTEPGAPGMLEMPAYLARPVESSGPHAAVIVLPEVFGLTPETRRMTDLVASLGHVGIAINYCHRTHPRLSEPYTALGVANALEAAARVTKRTVRRDVAAAIAWLNAQPFVKREQIATWGTGFGGTVAFITATLHELRGAIAFYPWHVATALPSGEPAPLQDVGDIAVPMLLCFGEDDYYVSRYDVDRIGSALQTAAKDFHIQVYAGVGHAFFRSGRPEAIAESRRYSDEAVAQSVADSWDLLQAFLNRVLSAPQVVSIR